MKFKNRKKNQKERRKKTATIPYKSTIMVKKPVHICFFLFFLKIKKKATLRREVMILISTTVYYIFYCYTTQSTHIVAPIKVQA